MIKFEKVKNLSNVNILRDRYFKELSLTMDGMWISIINNSEFYEIYYKTSIVGYFSKSFEGVLMQFYLSDEYLLWSHDIFTKVLNDYSIEIANVFTFDSLLFSLCLDFHKNITVHSYLFQDAKKNVTEMEDDNEFIRAEEKDFQIIKDFYLKNTEMDDSFIGCFVSELIAEGGCYVLFSEKNDEVLGIGELRKNIHRTSYVDLGVVVSTKNRGKGIGTLILTKLNNISNQRELKSICSCESDNVASKRMIEKAGFITNKHRLCMVQFKEKDMS